MGREANAGAAFGEAPRRLSALDADFLYLERRSQPLHIASIITFDGALDFERLLADLATRLHLAPRYMQRAVPTPLGFGHPTWETDPTFDLRRHVCRRWLRPPGDDQQLAALCAILYAQPLDRDRPLWEMHVIEGYHGTGESPGSTDLRASSRRTGKRDRSGTALLVKVHHSMVDGVGGVELLAILFDTVPQAAAPCAPPTIQGLRREPPSLARRVCDGVVERATARAMQGRAVLGLLARPRAALEQLRQTVETISHVGRTYLAGAPSTPFNGTIGTARQLGWVTFSLSVARAIKHRLGASLNDLVLAVTSGALRRVLHERGVDPDPLVLRAVVPVNRRSSTESLHLGNRISIMVAPVPVGIQDPIARMHRVHEATTQLKAADEPAKMHHLLGLAELLPPVAHRLLGFVRQPGKPINTVCTNVPGPPIPLYQQGVRVSRVLPFVPLVDGIGVAFAALTYDDALAIGVTADPGLVPDVDVVASALRTSFEELSSASGALGPAASAVA
jgi:WS/DGAT/MGAT family acyltransferase